MNWKAFKFISHYLVIQTPCSGGHAHPSQPCKLEQANLSADIISRRKKCAESVTCWCRKSGTVEVLFFILFLPHVRRMHNNNSMCFKVYRTHCVRFRSEEHTDYPELGIILLGNLLPECGYAVERQVLSQSQWLSPSTNSSYSKKKDPWKYYLSQTIMSRYQLLHSRSVWKLGVWDLRYRSLLTDLGKRLLSFGRISHQRGVQAPRLPQSPLLPSFGTRRTGENTAQQSLGRHVYFQRVNARL